MTAHVKSEMKVDRKFLKHGYKFKVLDDINIFKIYWISYVWVQEPILEAFVKKTKLFSIYSSVSFYYDQHKKYFRSV